MKEKWKDIEGYIGQYQVSNTGKIKTLARSFVAANGGVHVICERIMKGTLCNTGYISVTLTKKGKMKLILVHRLVAAAFIPNQNNLPQVNHIDTNKLNNNVDNLEWCTSPENTRHAARLGLIPNPTLGKFNEKHHRSKPIVQLDLNGSFIREWPCSMEAERHGYSSANIYAVINGRRNKHKNSIWKLANEK